MITEWIIGVVVDAFAWLVDRVFDLLGAPVVGSIQIPSPLVWAADILTTSWTAVFPALLLWFVWRQVKA